MHAHMATTFLFLLVNIKIILTVYLGIAIAWTNAENLGEGRDVVAFKTTPSCKTLITTLSAYFLYDMAGHFSLPTSHKTF